MEMSDGRRIKRSVFIDMKSVKFLHPELKKQLLTIQLIREYMETRDSEIARYNKDHEVNTDMPVNGRRMTNLGVFRKYLEAYLKQHPRINQEMSLMVRQRQPAETGIPLEVYAFCRDKEWAVYESVQSDIFDHILAVIPFFELRLFQNPTGDDFRKMAGKG
jgi:miniconductance mechanosensitive channel